MLSVTLSHVLPESLEISHGSAYFFLGGFLLMYLLEELLTPAHTHEHCETTHHHDESPNTHLLHIGVAGFLAITIHTIFDGVLLASIHESGDRETLYATIIGIAAHQIPVSFALASLLKSSRLREHTQYGYFALFLLAPFVGYIATILGLHAIHDSLIIALLSALSAGSLLYIATADLLPYIHRTSGKHRYEHIAVFLMTTIVVTLL